MRIGIITGSIHPPKMNEGETTGTMYGEPSSPVYRFEIGDAEYRMIARHSIPSRIPPHRVNHRANVMALKESGVECVISICSTGALKPEFEVPSIAVPEDFIDMTTIETFHDEDVYHITPSLDEHLRQALRMASSGAGIRLYGGGTYIQTSGPRLETKAEVRMLSNFGDYVGMNLASEAGLCCEVDLPVAGLITMDNHANGVTERELDFRDILSDARSRWEMVLGILTRLPSFMGALD
ncbi:MAG: MTAP family purine nucleoside phosphorylase [Thermoplasmatota archaeon]